MTPGMKTSEFMLSLVPIVLGVALLIVGALTGQSLLVDTGKWLLMGGTGAYAVSRGIAKVGAPPPTDDKEAASIVANIK